jgi:ATP/maltotriose-dependent transcriptional regulator MalT
MLDYLERTNLFLISLDDQRQWYRYHHLFAEVLRGRLQRTQPSLLPELHRRASTWYEQHGVVLEAIRHALAAPDVERVADLIEQRGYSFALQGQAQTMLGWLKRLPDALLLTRPRLCIVHATVLLFSNQLEASSARLLAQHLLALAAAVQAQVEVAHGNLAVAECWLKESGLSVDDEELSYPREREYLSLARVRIAEGRADPEGLFLPEALQMLARLLHDAERNARGGSVIEILILQALALQAQGQQEQALTVLQRVLALAEPESYMRLFLDEGPAMLALLHLAHARGLAPHYITRLLMVSGEQPSASAALPTPRSTVLVEPLTERELEVLHLIAAGASNEEIAEQLVIALGTVKRHVSNILGKLTVSSRTQAVARAQALALL